MRTLLQRIIRAGSNDKSDREQNKIVVANTISVSAFSLTVSNSLMLVLLGWYFAGLIDFAFGLLYPVFIIINHFGRQRLAKISLAVGAILHLSTMTMIFGTSIGFHYYLISIPALSFLIFDPDEYEMYLIVVVSLLSFVYLNFFFNWALDPISAGRGILKSIEVTNALLSVLLICVIVYVFYRELNSTKDRLEIEHQRSESLLLNILPESIAARLKHSTEEIADAFEETSILFADIVGFTGLSEALRPAELVRLLNLYFTEFDSLTEKHGVEKIKTIGDAYMVAAGIPDPKDNHAVLMADMALDMMEDVDRLNRELGYDLQIRIGINSGPAVAGVIGRKKYSYDLWGDTVNIASRMESQGVPNGIQVSCNTFRKLQGKYRLAQRGSIDVKGKGVMQTYLLLGREDSTPRK